ncbi:MAG: ribosome maturation factor RimM [Jannaschia helgolandensis]|jgi:16S rRNA processing protein RimM|uniref:Ribosome maturation factor RimM n=1 Tax=Jannaschia helgolandensis TaxID=188906 RepID=A0A1H7IB27_9RHOB|nr:ribosome maturation factor RimM [Jannaschia helgolandensis]SEK59689.1 16S rRNA processing protein RimM [Jannaschia helgolandensis]|tara:strand:+ start:1140 stop:1676 length:537 start_codon:yes stop_codon:yes gene_type:complete
MKDHVCLGAVMGSYGVRGECRVKSFCSDPSAIGDYGPLTLDNGTTSKLTVIRPIKGGYAVRLSGISQKEAADALKGQRLWAHRDALPELPDDEYYYSDLIGLTAFDTGGVEMGKIHAVHDHGAGDLLELRPKGGATVLLPFTRAVAPTVDLASGRIVLDPPKGLMPGDDEDADSDTTD